MTDGPLRVAFVVPTLEVGGLQRAIATIADNVDPARARIDVIALRDAAGGSTVMRDQLARASVDVHDLHVAGRAERDPLALASAVTRLRRLFVAQRYDVVDSAVLEADLASRVATVGTGAKHVTHLINLTHDDRAMHRERARQEWRPAAARWIDRVSGHLTTQFVAITHAVAASAQRVLGLPAAKIVVVERGVDSHRFRIQPRTPSSVLRVLCVGRLEPAKDHATALRTIRALQGRGIDVALTIAGSGALRGDVERTIHELALQEHVRLIEPVSNVEDLYAQHDALLFPSRWEGLGNAAIEAMACGLPVVATDLDVLREVLGPLGRHAPAGDAEGFADQLAAVGALPEEQRAALALELRDRAVRCFDPVETTTRLLDVYEAVAGAKEG